MATIISLYPTYQGDVVYADTKSTNILKDGKALLFVLKIIILANCSTNHLDGIDNLQTVLKSFFAF